VQKNKKLMKKKFAQNMAFRIKKIMFLHVFCFASLLTVHKARGQENPSSNREFPGAYLDVGGSKIYYEESGTGEAIVLVHDGLVSSMTWDGVWRTLAKKYHVVRYDRRGYGLSDPPAVPFSPIDDLYKLMAHLKIDHATFVGCSSGGGTAIDFTLVHPQMVDRLILIGSVLHGMVVSNAFGERGRRNNAPLGHGDYKAVAENWSNDPSTISAGDSTGKRRLYDALVRFPQNLKYTGNLEIRFAIPAVRRLSEIHAATLILVGEYDMPDVHAFEGAIQAGIAGARREIVKGCAHLIPLEKPEFLSERITSFIENHPFVKVPEDILGNYSGKYKIWGTAAAVILQDHQLYFRVPGEWDLPLFPESASKMKFFMWDHDAEMEFVKDSDGNINQAIIYGEGDGSVIKCPRI
jgi:3-oxoadipate enol-lactonase